MNVILNLDRTRKNVVSISEAVARSTDCLIDINDNYIFIENAPPIPDGIFLPRLMVDWRSRIAADKNAIVWEEVDPDAIVKRLAITKTAMIGRIKSDCNAALEKMVEPYPDLERTTWTTQHEQAVAYLADNMASVPYLQRLATARGETLDVLAQKIIDKATAFEVSADIIAQRQLLEKQIEALTMDSTPAEIDAVQAVIDSAQW